MPTSALFRDKAFLLLVVAVSLAFALIVSPFYEAAFWATVLAILFARPYRALGNLFGGRSSLAAIATVAIIVLLVILPAALIGTVLVRQGATVYERIQSGELDFARSASQILAIMPTWLADWVERLRLSSFDSVQDPLAAAVRRALQFFAAHAANLGQSTAELVLSFFIMLYLLFFFLRDGSRIALRIRAAVPLQDDLQSRLTAKFKGAIRATMKGNLVIAFVQGALGGIIFWLLGIQAAAFWAVVMAFLSLLPAVGAALVWLPVALYLLATGAVWQGVVLLAFGVLAISLVDNLLRPVLVGKETQMPDYVVAISTLGGIAIFGMVGLVIGPVIAALFIAVWDVVARADAGAEAGSEGRPARGPKSR